MQRIFINLRSGRPMDEATESAFRRALEAEITAFSIRERAQGGAFIPLRVKKWDAKRGGWS